MKEPTRCEKGANRGRLVFVLSFVGPFTLWLASEIIHSVISNPGDVLSFKEFRSEMSTPTSAYSVTNDSGIFFYVTGPIRPFLALPSGPPAYVFDSSGNLVDWTRDLGEDSTYVDEWGDLGWSEVTLSELDSAFGVVASP